MIFIGIDPGQSGGVAVLNGYGVPLCVNSVKDRTPREVANLLGLYQHASFATLELVHSMPKQGVASSFKFGRSFGMLEGMLAALGIPYALVSPSKWQQTLGCLSRGNKNVTKTKAQQLYPAVTVTHAVADALLIAHYCMLTYHRPAEAAAAPSPAASESPPRPSPEGAPAPS